MLQSFDNCNHVACDTAFLFPSGEVIVASRAVLATQCSSLTPTLYNTEGTTLVVLNGLPLIRLPANRQRSVCTHITLVLCQHQFFMQSTNPWESILYAISSATRLSIPLIIVPYPIKVSTLSGQMCDSLVRGNEVVLDLKEKLCLVHGIPVSEQRLVFKQQQLQDDCSFLEQEVVPGSTLHLVLAQCDPSAAAHSFRCPNMNPALSIHRFKVGFSTDQLKHCLPLQSTSPQTHPHHTISLPAHLAHIVHVDDVPYPAFWTFLRYLHCRTLKYEGGEGSF